MLRLLLFNILTLFLYRIIIIIIISTGIRRTRNFNLLFLFYFLFFIFLIFLIFFINEFVMTTIMTHLL